MNINYYIEEAYNKVRWGEVVYKHRSSNSYYLMNGEYEVIYNPVLESITISNIRDSGKECILYLEKNNLERGYVRYDEYLFNSFIELLVNICITDQEINRLNKNLDSLVDRELFERATILRDIINNLESILNN